MNLHQPVLGYEGTFSQQTTRFLLGAVERCLDECCPSVSLRRKIVRVMVEALQNVSMHESSRPGDQGMSVPATGIQSVFRLSRLKQQYCVMTGNTITRESFSKLNDCIALINGLDNRGLRALYKERLVSADFVAPGGAGLGLLYMARKSGAKLQFAFSPLESSEMYFRLKVNLS